jgi:hypothetical protein
MVSFFVQYRLNVSLVPAEDENKTERLTLRHLYARQRQYCSMASYQHVPASQFQIQANRQLNPPNWGN